MTGQPAYFSDLLRRWPLDDQCRALDELPPGAEALLADLATALREFLAARDRRQALGAVRAGAAASRQARMKDAEARAELIRDDWQRSNVETDVLLERAGKQRRGKWKPMAWRTADRLLGKRPTAYKSKAAPARQMPWECGPDV